MIKLLNYLRLKVSDSDVKANKQANEQQQQ